MYELEEAEYQCPVCERKQAWRPESAGRPVTCACGVVLTIPFAPGAAETRVNTQASVGEETASDNGENLSVEVEESEAAPVEVILCPDCGASMRPGAIVCPHCGYHRPKPKKRVFRRRASEANRLAPAAEHWHELTVRPFRDRNLPIGLALAGLVIQLSMLAHFSGHWARAIAMTPLTALFAAATVAVIFLIALLLTPVLDLSLGPIVPLCVKLSAAVIFPAAVVALFWAMLGQTPTGMIAGWMAAMVLYLSLFRLLFEFDWPDAMLLIALVSLAHTVILLVVLYPLTFGSFPVGDLWRLYKPIAAQSAITFLVAGGLVAPHFGQA